MKSDASGEFAKTNRKIVRQESGQRMRLASGGKVAGGVAGELQISKTHVWNGLRLLIVAFDPQTAGTLQKILESTGLEISQAATVEAAQRALSATAPDLVLMDISFPDDSGLDLIATAASHPSEPVIVVLAGDDNAEIAVEALHRGAYDYFSKPIEEETVIRRISSAVSSRYSRVESALAERRREEESSDSLVELRSPGMIGVLEQVRRVAEHDTATVLVSGETGVGKEHVSRMIHELSPRVAEPLITLNCANLDRTLLQSELFGHERGAFTGAHERRLGLFELASRGTLFLDEVGEMPLDVQASFLRVLETKKFRRLGGNAELTTGARVVAATNKPLLEMVKAGRFREDLFFRLNVMEIRVPPLRERPEDIVGLAEYFCQRIARSMGTQTYLTDDAMEKLLYYSWPGNIRELKNVIERTVLIGGSGPINGGRLHLDMTGYTPGPEPGQAYGEIADTPRHYSAGSGGDNVADELMRQFRPLADVEALHIQRVLDACAGNRTRAASVLGIARSTLIRKLEAMKKARQGRNNNKKS